MGASISSVTDAFTEAARAGDIPALGKLMMQRLDLVHTAHTWKGHTAWHIAACHGHKDVLQFLYDTTLRMLESPTGSLGPKGWKPFLKLGHSPQAMVLGLMNEVDYSGHTPIILACMHGHVQCVEYLARTGADLYVVDYAGLTVLHHAAMLNKHEIMAMLLGGFSSFPRQRIDSQTGLLVPDNRSLASLVDVSSFSGMTPLHYAVNYTSRSTVQVLLSYEACILVQSRALDEGIPCSIGSTPLHLAALRGDAEVVRLLLGAHAQMMSASSDSLGSLALFHSRNPRVDPRSMRNFARELPYHIALRKGFTALTEMLHPNVPYTYIFNNEDLQAMRIYGPTRLTVIAAAAVQKKLLEDIAHVEAELKEMKHRQCVGGAASLENPEASGRDLSFQEWSSSLKQQASTRAQEDGLQSVNVKQGGAEARITPGECKGTHPFIKERSQGACASKDSAAYDQGTSAEVEDREHGKVARSGNVVGDQPGVCAVLAEALSEPRDDSQEVTASRHRLGTPESQAPGNEGDLGPQGELLSLSSPFQEVAWLYAASELAASASPTFPRSEEADGPTAPRPLYARTMSTVSQRSTKGSTLPRNLSTQQLRRAVTTMLTTHSTRGPITSESPDSESMGVQSPLQVVLGPGGSNNMDQLRHRMRLLRLTSGAWPNAHMDGFSAESVANESTEGQVEKQPSTDEDGLVLERGQTGTITMKMSSMPRTLSRAYSSRRLRPSLQDAPEGLLMSEMAHLGQENALAGCLDHDTAVVQVSAEIEAVEAVLAPGPHGDSDDEGEDYLCSICFDRSADVSIQPCNHALCPDCSRELCKLHHFHPALCPFCRSIIFAFDHVH